MKYPDAICRSKFRVSGGVCKIVHDVPCRQDCFQVLSQLAIKHLLIVYSNLYHFEHCRYSGQSRTGDTRLLAPHVLQQQVYHRHLEISDADVQTPPQLKFDARFIDSTEFVSHRVEIWNFEEYNRRGIKSKVEISYTRQLLFKQHTETSFFVLPSTLMENSRNINGQTHALFGGLHADLNPTDLIFHTSTTTLRSKTLDQRLSVGSA